MSSNILPALRMAVVMTLLTGLAYPAVLTAIAQVVFPGQAHGSLVSVNGRVVGSRLIGQNFAKPEYFHLRPSAAGASGYDAADIAGRFVGDRRLSVVSKPYTEGDLAGAIEGLGLNPGPSA